MQEDQVKVEGQEEPGLDWLEERKTGLGGSDMAAVLGVSEFKDNTPARVYDEKVGDAEPREDTALMERGRILEPIAADWWARVEGRNVRRQPMRRHKEYPWMIGNIDRQVLASNGNPTELLEVYIPGITYFQKTKLHGLHNDKNVQGQHYCEVYGYPRVHYAVLDPNRWELLTFTVDRDDAFISEMVVRGDHFWHEFVLKGIRPPEEAPEPIELPEVSGEVQVWESPEQLRALADLAEAASLKADSEEILDFAKEAVQRLMCGVGSDAEFDPKKAAIIANVIEGLSHRIYWREQSGRKTLDKKALVKAHPEVDLEKFQKQGNPFRVFKPFFDVVR